MQIFLNYYYFVVKQTTFLGLQQLGALNPL